MVTVKYNLFICKGRDECEGKGKPIELRNVTLCNEYRGL